MLVNSMCGWFRVEQQQEQYCHDKRSACRVQPGALPLCKRSGSASCHGIIVLQDRAGREQRGASPLAGADVLGRVKLNIPSKRNAMAKM